MLLPARALRAVRAYGPTFVVHLFVAWVYVWFATGGKYEFRGDGGYYGMMAEAFLAGQAHLKTTPPPEMLTLADPYEPEQYAPIANRLPDGAYYNGKYYMYWGPVPGVIHAAWQAVSGKPLQANLIMFVFGFGACLIFWAILRELRSLAFPDLSDGWVDVVYVCGTLGGVGLFLQARPIIHHEAIAAASLFAVAGCYFLLRALRAPDMAWKSLAASGLLFGLAIGSRMTQAIYLLGFGALFLPALLRPNEWRSGLARLLLFAMPASFIIVLLLIYNYVRFDSFLEFGTRYVQTGVQNLNKSLFSVFDLKVLPNNIMGYLFYVPEFSPYFPWFVTRNWIPPVANVGYALEPPFVSVLLAGPLLLFLPATVVWAIRSWRNLHSATGAFVASTGAGVIGSIAIVLANNWATARYVQDFYPFACLLAAPGLWWIISHVGRFRPTNAWRAIVRPATGVLVGCSVLVGSSLGIWELGLWPDSFQGLAYPLDRAEAALVQRFDPERWPSSYLSELPRRRPWGVFYPDGASVRFDVPTTMSVKELNMWSLFPHRTVMRVRLNGSDAGEWPIAPGQIRITFPNPIPPSAAGHLDVELAFPSEHPIDPPGLWPITVATVGLVAP